MLDAAGISDPSVVLQPPPLARQPVGVRFEDPTFGTTLRRMSAESDAGGFGTQIYSQLQAFSSDNAYVLLISNGNYVVRRTNDLTPVTGLDPSEWNVPRWHPARAHTIVHFDTNGDTDVTLQYTDVDTATTIDAAVFPPEYERIFNNQSFDELSRDGRWLGGMAARAGGDGVIFAFDLQTGRLGAQLLMSSLYAGPCEEDPTWGVIEPDWVGVSPLGRYLVVQWPRDGTARCSGLETFNISNGTFVGRVYDGHQHGDLGVMADGTTEFFMTFELWHPQFPNNPSIGLRRLPGTSTVQEPTYLQPLDWGGGHISCRGPAGACLVSYGGWPGEWTPFEEELFLQYADGRVDRLAHHRSSACGYWVQPRATMSRDGSFVVFASDWSYGTGTDGCGSSWLGSGDPYLIELGSTPPPPPPPTPDIPYPIFWRH